MAEHYVRCHGCQTEIIIDVTTVEGDRLRKDISKLEAMRKGGLDVARTLRARRARMSGNGHAN
jgi:hypothetical protein